MAYDILLPSPGESVTEAEIATWHKEDGEYVEKDDVILEVETDKASLEICAEQSGILKIEIQEGEVVEVGALLGKIEDGEAPAGSSQQSEPAPEPAKESSNEQPAQSSSASSIEASGPAVRRILDEKGIDGSGIQASGKDGRLTKGDVLNAPVATSSSPAPAPAAAAPAPVSTKAQSKKAGKGDPAPGIDPMSPGYERTETLVPMSRMRKKIAARLKEVQNTAASLTTFNEVDLSAIKKMRAKYKESFKENHGVGLGFMSFFTKASVMALQKFPVVNSEMRDEDFAYKNYCDVGIAVGTDRGLVVPVLRNVQSMGLAQIESEILRLALKARDGKLGVDEMSGGTFTITNGGVYGSMLSTPILNAPQTAILGMHNIVERPVVVNGQIEIRPMMYLALSYDHRVIDGAEAVQFLVTIKNCLEDPARMLLDLG